MLRCKFSSITTPKLGNSVEENEDNILKPSKQEAESDIILKFAISDGATESSFSKEWSDLLVSSYKDKSFDEDHLAETVRVLSETWHAMTTTKEPPWYAEQKAEQGAFATFLGLTINRVERSFEAMAIGDCTLFHVREDELRLTFPVTTLEEFGNTPNLIASNSKYQVEFGKCVLYKKDLFNANDLIVLSTDALAAWIWKQNNKGEKPWNILIKLVDNKMEFENWLNDQRQLNEIKNDDVSLLILKFEE
jgi:hypothetical protein